MFWCRNIDIWEGAYTELLKWNETLWIVRLSPKGTTSPTKVTMFVLVSGKINKKNLEHSSPFQSCGRRLSVIHLLYSFPSCCLGRCLSVIYPHLGWRVATEQGKGPRAKYSDCCCPWQVFIYYYATLIDFPNSLFFLSHANREFCFTLLFSFSRIFIFSSPSQCTFW